MKNYRLTERTVKDKDGKILDKKKVIVADTEKLTSAEWRIVDAYLRTGTYALEEQKVKKAKKEIGYTRAEITEYLKTNDADGYKELQKREKAEEKFIKTLAWFRKEYPNYIADREKENK